MVSFSERLKALRREQGLSQSALAEIVGVSKSSINMYERGDREPGFATVAALAEQFGVDTDYLLGRTPYRTKDVWLCENAGLEPLKMKRLPVLGEIACGRPIFAEEDRESYALTGSGVRADFCLRARGDSMIGARIMDGDLVFIRRQPMVENGEIAAVIIDDTATLKRVYYYPEERKLSLNAENPQYAPLIYVGEELEHITILGKAVAFQSGI